MDEIEKFINDYERKQKKESLSSLEIKECRKDAIQLLIEFELWNLKTEIWHEVKPWENIWRIIYEHSISIEKSPISPSRLEDIGISPWDKIYFTKDYVYISFLKWWYKIVPFDENTCVEENNNKKISPENTTKKEKKPPEKQMPIIKASNEEENIWFQTIFDKESPLLWDKIAYKNEVEIRKLYGKSVSYLIQTYCEWSLIDENFLYGVIARESRFDKNARSYTWVRWLWQITSDTVETIVNINNAKTKSDPKSTDLYISSSIKDKNGKLDRVKVLHPLNQFKLTISYLLYLESLFQWIWNENFRKELIITSYNLWPWKTQEILWKYKHIKDWNGLKKALKEAAHKWQITQWKLKEITEYVPAVMENIKIASL